MPQNFAPAGKAARHCEHCIPQQTLGPARRRRRAGPGPWRQLRTRRSIGGQVVAIPVLLLVYHRGQGRGTRSGLIL